MNRINKRYFTSVETCYSITSQYLKVWDLNQEIRPESQVVDTLEEAILTIDFLYDSVGILHRQGLNHEKIR